MKLDYIKDKEEMLSVVLFGVSVFLGVLILIKVTSFFVAPARAENIAKEAVLQGKLNANDMEKHFAEDVAVAGKLKKDNLFAPPPPKQHPVNEVLGIMGNEALIGGRWYKVGDRIADARIVAIEPAQVRIEWDGSEKVFAPIDARGSSEAAGPARGGPEMGDVAGRGPGRGGAPLVSIPSGPGGFGEFSPPEGGGGFESMRARFQNMSEEERQAFRERMRGRSGGGGGGSGDRGGGDSGGGRRRSDGMNRSQ
jgi:uncharacterized membrane protein YgcG